MADPTARFVLTAEDRTARAFASAERNLRTVARSALQFRSVLAGFGVVVSGRMFANWIKDAIEIEKLTVDQAKAIGDAGKAMRGLNTEFQNLARTVVTELAPGLETAAKFWREFFFPSGSQFGQAADQIREQVDAQIEEVTRLERLLENQKNWEVNASGFDKLIFGSQIENIQETTGALAAARVELERFRGAWQAALRTSGTTEPSFEQFLGKIEFEAEMRRLADIAKGQPVSQEISAFVSALQEAEAITRSMRTDVEEQVEAWQRAKFLFDEGLLDGETLKRLDEQQLQPFNLNDIRALYKPALKEMETDVERFAEAAGRGLHGTLVDAFMGVEVSFGDMLRRMAAEAATSALFGTLATFFGGMSGGAASFASKFFGGSRASTGSVRGGMMYKVHEGEAFFKAGSDGHVGKTGGRPSISIGYVDARGATDPAAVEAAVHRGVLTAVSINDARTDAKLNAFSRPAMA